MEIDMDKIIEYRKQHPKCKFCTYRDVGDIFMCCEVKKRIVLPREAKRCELYKVEKN